MAVEPILSLACSMQAQKGIYALLLGSGISRSSGIPTGWEITLDLIKKVAVLNGETNINDPEQWYIEKFEKAPDYSELLDQLAKTPTERNQLLKGYFESSTGTDDPSLKKPTKAHLAIAQMVKDGYIKVIVTTNFDRLLETALATVGIVPDVISTADQVKGALPLIHSKCTILKINGDYMDTRIKNTITELSSYDEAMNKYLSRILDEFGLIICGWSGEWDTALKDNIFRSESNRFTTYWLQKGQLTDSAQRIITFKHAQVIDIESADSFFEKLQDNLISLNDLSMRRDPLSIDVACATLKRLLPDTKNIIKINDLIMDECKRVINRIEHLEWSVAPNKDTTRQKIEQIENICKPILFLTSLGCYWDDNKYDFIWKELFLQLSNIKCPPSYTPWENLINYPSLLTMYTMLIVCLKTENYRLLYLILNEVKSNKMSRYESPQPIATFIYPYNIIDKKSCNDTLFNGQSKKVPMSERLSEVLENPALQVINSEDDYENLFNKAEFFYAVNFWYNEALIEGDSTLEKSWAPIGRFGYKIRWMWKWEMVFNEELILGNEWAAIQSGFFGKSIENFKTCCNNLYKWVKSLPEFI